MQIPSPIPNLSDSLKLDDPQKRKPRKVFEYKYHICGGGSQEAVKGVGKWNRKGEEANKLLIAEHVTVELRLNVGELWDHVNNYKSLFHPKDKEALAPISHWLRSIPRNMKLHYFLSALHRQERVPRRRVASARSGKQETYARTVRPRVDMDGVLTVSDKQTFQRGTRN